MSDPFYGTTDGFKGYWSDRGNATVDAMEDSDIEAALLVASCYLDAAFISSFMGMKTGGRNQIREWPRIGVQDIYGYAIDNSVEPREVDNATYEAALRQITTPGIFFKDYSPSKYKSVAVSGAINVTYAIGSAFDFQTQMPALAAILYPILTGLGSGSFSSASGGTARV